MQAQAFQAPRRQWAVRPLIAALAAIAGGPAWADEPSPWYIGASQTITHDSNVDHAPNGSSGTYFSTGVLGGFDQRVSRQRFYGAADVKYNKYQSQSRLDNVSYGVNAGWDWETIESLSGNLYANANRSLALLGGNSTQPTSSDNTVRSEGLGANVRWGGVGPVSLQGGYSHRRVSYSAPEALSSESTTNTGSLGAYYRLNQDLSVGTAVRVSRTESPYAVALTVTPTGPADYRSSTSTGRNLDFLVDWRPGPRTGVNGRLSWTRQSSSEVDAADFSGVTGSLALSYAATEKLGFTATASRDAGSQVEAFTYNIGQSGSSVFLPISSIRGVAQNQQVTDALGLGATFAATAKTSVKAGLGYRRAKLVEAIQVLGNTVSGNRIDTYRTASIGVDFEMSRHWQFGCGLAHESRDVGAGSTTLSPAYSYTATITSCTATFALR